MRAFLGNVIHTAVFIGICGLVLLTGWNDPIQYRFLSENEIAEREKALLPPEPPPAPVVEKVPPHRWQMTGTSLDRAPYEIRNGEVSYSKNYDKREMGVPTENPFLQYKERADSETKIAPPPAPRR